MSSTNKTTHYELSQYVSSDKPSYLGDYNSDMLKIDTGINAAKTAADTAQTDATAAGTAATNAQSTANTAVTNAATAQSGVNTNATNIGILANLNTTAKTSLVAAVNEVNSKEFVVNSMSGTQTNKAPSVSTVKDYVKGVVLYTNPNTSSMHSSLNITLSSSDYDKLIFEFNLTTGDASVVTVEIEKNENGSISGINIDNGVMYGMRRIITRIDNTHYNIGECYQCAFGNNVVFGQGNGLIIRRVIGLH